AMRYDPLLLQRLIRGFDGVRRPGGGGSGPHPTSAASHLQASASDAHEQWPTFAGQPMESEQVAAHSVSQASTEAANSGGSLGGSHGGGGAKAGPDNLHLGDQVSNGLPSSQASSG